MMPGELNYFVQELFRGRWVEFRNVEAGEGVLVFLINLSEPFYNGPRVLPLVYRCNFSEVVVNPVQDFLADFAHLTFYWVDQSAGELAIEIFSVVF